MRMRNVLTLFVILLFSIVYASAQTPPAAPGAPTAPAPGQPMTYSYLFDGSNYMGVVPEEINRSNMGQYGLSSPRGVGVSRVTEGSPAEKAGVKKGDVILQFDGEQVATVRKLQRLIGEAAPEQSVRLTISRNGSEQHVNVTLGRREGVFGQGGFRVQTPMPRGSFPEMPRSPRTWGGNGESYSFSLGSNRRVGITTSTLTKQLADYFGVSGGRGLLITSVTENSPASKAGLKAGDVVTQVNGEKVEDADDFIRALNRKEEGEVTLTIIRDKSERTIKVTPERRQGQTYNLSGMFPSVAGAIAAPRALMDLPNVRALQSLPRIESFSVPRVDTMIAPRLLNLPRVAPLAILPDME